MGQHYPQMTGAQGMIPWYVFVVFLYNIGVKVRVCCQVLLLHDDISIIITYLYMSSFQLSVLFYLLIRLRQSKSRLKQLSF